ncbi:uncharacterized protein HD556DRAFT_1399569 [Suillus plorans]|uniref:Uncharacterized protein n=1 Tax=Suillus plorans TaxID=116603 RepID=A0A9P7AGU3_9AGAM|nr:uncharacterized protein HD556DRAFT_1399569 [Suillus plorans]KAG1789175.1 hypothetical protein HD556DRAFT_1399569 [Suillus plorans]
MRYHISQIMRLSLILAIVAAFKLAVSIPVVVDDGDCPVYCNVGDCCPSYDCQPIERCGRSNLCVSVIDPPNYSEFPLLPWCSVVDDTAGTCK